MVPLRLERFTAPGSVGDLAYPRMVSEKESFARSRFAGIPALWCAFFLLRGILAPFSFLSGPWRFIAQNGLHCQNGIVIAQNGLNCQNGFGFAVAVCVVLAVPSHNGTAIGPLDP